MIKINIDKYTKAIDEICYKLDHEVYLPINKIIPSDIVHDFGARKEVLKQFIEDTIYMLREDARHMQGKINQMEEGRKRTFDIPEAEINKYVKKYLEEEGENG